ncbi:MAG: hypothetical protein ACJ8AI_25820 [Rhodopila sp.]
MACSCWNGKTTAIPGKSGGRVPLTASMASFGTSYGGASASGAPASAGMTPPAWPAPICAPTPGCPACGQLECLCRPRWVAGMVVSEADLNRLDYYMTAKQRLHNRQLFGSGVVCGMVVTCHPCGGGIVSVSPGYALGPCGEDIVVCAADAVDVCGLISQCRAQEQQAVNCRPWGDTTGCQDVQETWVLAIRYIEQPSRNAPMLRAAVGASDCGCGCGGSGCSCGTSSAAGMTQSGSAMPTACAPSVVCETYRYEVFRAPAQPDCSGETKLPPGRLAQQIAACSGDIVTLLDNPPKEPLGPNLSPGGITAWSQYCAKIKAALYAHFTRFGTGHCDQLVHLCQINCPPTSLNPTGFSNAMQQVGVALRPILLAALQDCICLAILPPCPDVQHDPRVPLAVITVSGAQNCTVVDICNWTPLRKIVGTFPNWGYWLSEFNLIETLRNTLFCLCCEPFNVRATRASALAENRAAAAAAASPFGPALSDLGILGAWLGNKQGDVRDVLTSLNIVPDPAETAALTRRVAALEAELAKLRPDVQSGHS